MKKDRDVEMDGSLQYPNKRSGGEMPRPSFGRSVAGDGRCNARGTTPRKRFCSQHHCENTVYDSSTNPAVAPQSQRLCASVILRAFSEMSVCLELARTRRQRVLLITTGLHSKAAINGFTSAIGGKAAVNQRGR
jgi:hypothetical protein